LPACLKEEPAATGEAVGRYEFAPAFLQKLRSLVASNQGREASQEALQCASEVAKALREAATAIRLGNASAN